MKLNPIMLAVALCCLGTVVQAEEVRRPYIVKLGDQPIASYNGGVNGLRATKPANGQSLDLKATNVQQYAQYLTQQQASVIAAVAAAPVQYRFQLALNGFAAMLTDSEVRLLKARGDVASITPDGRRYLVNNYTPTFLGLDKAGGLWNKLGGTAGAGEDVVIGIIDTGIGPENPAYSDRVDSQGIPTIDTNGKLAYGAPPAGWQGSCASGQGFEERHCNNKLIGAQYFASGFLAADGPLHWSEFLSPRDSNGHGTHTSTTAAGNANVRINTKSVDLGSFTGMAPRARLASYKVCWTGIDPDGFMFNSCYGSDSVAAIEQAVRDGVDVLNYSISGGWTLDDPVGEAFLHAADAGVFVAAAGGNDGPAHFTLSHVGPWLTTVAAANHDGEMVTTLTLGDGRQFRGPSMTGSALPQTAMIMAIDAALPGANPTLAMQCANREPISDNPIQMLDPEKTKGKIVVCRLGTDPLAAAESVRQAGGVGLVLIDEGARPGAYQHAVPTIMLPYEDGEQLTVYMRRPGQPSGAISAFSNVTGRVPAPVIARFSSRGPGPDMNMMKPDLAAPGVDVLAGVVRELTQDQHDQLLAGSFTPEPAWSFYSGTSMAAPHVAGIGAMLKQLHPDWSPAAIKSALMTSASDTLPDNLGGLSNRGTLPWAQGSGHIVPNKAADPGLVYDAGPADYAKYLCNAGIDAHCGSGSAPAYNLNVPSITVYNAANVQTITRRVTNVGNSSATYTASASLSGFDVSVSPSSLTLAPGASASFTVTLKRRNAADRVWQYGSLVWSDGVHRVATPLQVTAGRLVDMPSPIVTEKASGMRALSVFTSRDGKLTPTLGGLKPVVRSNHEVAQAPLGTVDTREQIQAACQAGGPGVRVIPFTLPQRTMAARFELFDRDTGDNGGHDLDLAVLNPGGEITELSRLQGSNERVVLENPLPGQYKVCVVGNWVMGNGSTSFSLSSAIVTPDDNGTLKLSLPGKTYQGAYATVGVSWSGATAGQRYVGAVQLTDEAGNVGTTTLSVDTTDPVPLAFLPKPANARRKQ